MKHGILLYISTGYLFQLSESLNSYIPQLCLLKNYRFCTVWVIDVHFGLTFLNIQHGVRHQSPLDLTFQVERWGITSGGRPSRGWPSLVWAIEVQICIKAFGNTWHINVILDTKLKICLSVLLRVFICPKHKCTTLNKYAPKLECLGLYRPKIVYLGDLLTSRNRPFNIF